MSAVPLLRLLSLIAALGGGIAIGHYLIPHGGTAGQEHATESPESPSPSPSAGKGSASAVPSGKRFNGSIADLLRIVREAGGYERAQAQLLIALSGTPAAELRRLTVSFPWKSRMNAHATQVYSALLSQWAEKDAEGVLKWSASLSADRLHSTRRMVIESLARNNPAKALVEARAIKNAGQRRSAMICIINAISATDPRRALAVYQTLGNNLPSAAPDPFAGNNLPGDCLSSIFNRWAWDEPAEAFAAAAALGKSNDRNLALASALQAWAGVDPAAAHAVALGLPVGAARTNALLSVLGAWAGEDPRAAHAAASALPDGRARTEALHSVFSAWANVDPQAAHAAASALPEGRARAQAMENVIQSWASKDPRGALTATLALPKGQSRLNAMGSVFGAWAADDPHAAAAAATSAGLSRNDKLHVTREIVQAWAQSDAAAALAWAQTLPAREGGDSAVASALSQLASTDGPAAAAAWSELSPQQRKNQVGNIINSWVWQDREAATRWARSLENPRDRAAAISGCLSGLEFCETEKITALLNELPAGPARIGAIRNVVAHRTNDDPEGTVNWLLTLTENERTAAMNSFSIYELSSGDPMRVAALLRDTPALGAHDYVWTSVAQQMAAEDPEAALTWAGTLGAPRARRQSTDQVMRTWAHEDAPGALARAQAFTDGAQRESAVRGVLETWAGSDPDAVLAWAATASGEEREIALLHGSLQKADNEPAASAAIVGQLLSQNAGADTPSHLASAASNVARAWFQQDMTQAAHWAVQLPAGDAQENAVNAIAEAWTGLDPIAASEWVRQLPHGNSRDRAAQTLSQGIQQSDPESAFTWAVSIGDQERRDDAARNAARSWHWHDREAARAAVTQAPISETVRTSLLEEMAKPE